MRKRIGTIVELNIFKGLSGEGEDCCVDFWDVDGSGSAIVDDDGHSVLLIIYEDNHVFY